MAKQSLSIEENIKCPHCGGKFHLAEAISDEITELARAKVEKEFQSSNTQLQNKLNELEEASRQFKLTAEKEKQALKLDLEAQIKHSLEGKYAAANLDLLNQVEEERQKSKLAQEKELELRKLQRQLETQAQSQELEMQRKLDEERKIISENAFKTANEKSDRIIAEQTFKMEQMKKALEEATRKSMQGSQQVQGEVLEMKIEEQLGELFPLDEVAEVKKGVRGGDALLRVKMSSGRLAGGILIECKDTKEWGPHWTAKLKTDIQNAGADVGIIVSTTLPRDIRLSGEIDGVWVCKPEVFKTVVTLIREGLILACRAAMQAETPVEKKDFLFQYMTSAKFVHKIRGICENTVNMKASLATERRAAEKSWKKREQEIDIISTYLAGLYGELEAVVGSALPKVDLLELAGGSESVDEPLKIQ